MTEHEQMVEDCEQREERLSDWERGFCESLRDALSRGRSLTPKQIEILDRIWTQATARG